LELVLPKVVGSNFTEGIIQKIRRGQSRPRFLR
jgi:hypothetical protein